MKTGTFVLAAAVIGFGLGVAPLWWPADLQSSKGLQVDTGGQHFQPILQPQAPGPSFDLVTTVREWSEDSAVRLFTDTHLSDRPTYLTAEVTAQAVRVLAVEQGVMRVLGEKQGATGLNPVALTNQW